MSERNICDNCTQETENDPMCICDECDADDRAVRAAMAARDSADNARLAARVVALEEALPKAWYLGFVKGRDYEAMDAVEAMHGVDEFTPERDPELAALAAKEGV